MWPSQVTAGLKTTNVPNQRHINIKFYESCCKKTVGDPRSSQTEQRAAPPSRARHPELPKFWWALAAVGKAPLAASPGCQSCYGLYTLRWKPCFEKAGCFQFTWTRWVAVVHGGWWLVAMGTLHTPASQSQLSRDGNIHSILLHN